MIVEFTGANNIRSIGLLWGCDLLLTSSLEAMHILLLLELLFAIVVGSKFNCFVAALLSEQSFVVQHISVFLSQRMLHTAC